MSKSVLKCLTAQKAHIQNTEGVSGIKGCKCSFSTYMLGDGCGACNPSLALEYAKENIQDLEKQVESQQARIDELMLEYCPDEMTQEQIDNWKNHQQPVMEDVKAK